MGEFEDKLSSIMNNPEMMQKIMSIAQSMQSHETEEPENHSPPQPQQPAFPDIDISMLQKLSGFAQKSGIDKNKQNLLSALSPYISANRIAKLERAMRAAKMAGLATTLLGR